MGSGFGGTAQDFIAHARKKDPNTKIHIDCFEVSARENECNREVSKNIGIQDHISVYDKSYLDTGKPDQYYDLIISEDAFLHCPDHEALFKEISRTLKPGGYLVFTDPMKTENADQSALQAIYKRLNLTQMGGFKFYNELTEKYNIKNLQQIELSKHMKKHYAAVRKLLLEKGKEFGISDEYINNASQSLQYWVDGVENGNLTWGILVYQKNK